jgi:pimeloyl-ACP methyl ester carboxylesterase
VTFEPAERWFRTPAGRMNYAEGGSGSRPVVLIHGVTLRWQSMAEIITELAESSHIYAGDLRGHGRSEWADSGYRVSDYVEDISAFVGAVSKVGSVLIGYSLGGLVALGVAARLPDLVAGVIAIDPPLVLRDSDFEATAYSDAHDWIRWVNHVVGGALTPSEAVAQFAAMNPGTGDADARQALADIAPTDPRATAAFVENHVFEDSDIEHTLDRVVCPALLLAGNLELGSLIRDKDLDFFTAHTAHGRASRIPGSGHGLLWDEPARTVRTEVTDFLAAM